MGLREEIQNLLNQNSTQQFKVYMNGSLLETAQPKTEAEVGEIVEAIASNDVEVRITVTDMKDNTILNQVFNAPETLEIEPNVIVKLAISAEGKDVVRTIQGFKEAIVNYCEFTLKKVKLNVFNHEDSVEMYAQIF